MWVAFALQKLLTFFQQKYQNICISLDVNFNESLTNDIISFEQLGPAWPYNIRIDHEIIILPLLLIKKGSCQFLAKVCAQSTG